jgi:ribose transport system permease protein
MADEARVRGGAWRRAGVLRAVRERPLLVLCGLLIALVVGLDLARPGMVSAGWVSNTILFAAPLGIVAAGQTLVMLTGGIDLSVATVMTAAAYIAASQSSFGTPRALILAIAAGVLVGFVNGLGVAVFRVQPLIMTLGMGLVVAGVLLVYSLALVRGGPPQVPPFVRFAGSDKLFGLLPVSLIPWAAIALTILVGLRRTGFGRLLYAVGDNPLACRLAGVRVWTVLLATYVISGFLSGIAGLLLVGATNAADLSLGDVYLLPSIAAVVIGGTSIYGGQGGYAGTIVGALILTVLNSLFTVLDAPDAVKQVLYGAIVLLLAATYTRAAAES